MLQEETQNIGTSPYNPRAVPGDIDYRPGPDWPPSVSESAWWRGLSDAERAEKHRTHERVCEACGRPEEDVGPHQLCVWCVSQAVMDAQRP